MFQKITRTLDSFTQRYTPDPFLYAALLTGLIFLLALFFTPNTALGIANFWGSGFWGLLNFTQQMVMILFLGSVCALSSPVQKFLRWLAYIPCSLTRAAVLLSIVSIIACFINWGFGLILSALYCKELGARFKNKKFPVLVACAYSGFLVWHGGLSGSIPLVIATPENFTQEIIGSVIPLGQTILSPLNLILLSSHFIALPIISYLLIKFWPNINTCQQSISHPKQNTTTKAISHNKKTPAELLENSILCSVIILFLGLLFFANQIYYKNFSLDLNQINLLLFLCAILLHQTPKNFLKASHKSVEKIWALLIQYPLYAGIMAIMQQSGLAEIISQQFLAVANTYTLPFWVYLSAGLVNIFVPSGGGQWAVQAPMVISVAHKLGADLNSVILAVSWGDAWTNMVQPFWALPLLAIAGLKAKDIMGILLIILFASGFISSCCFLIFY